jgi:CubicO group peptidase (beta-lactamase class C family)
MAKMSRRVRFALVVAVLTLGLGVRVEAQAPDRMTANLNAYLTALDAYGVSATVLVARGGQVLVRRGIGWADRERRIRNVPATAFALGSLSKQFTAAAILKLEEQGKLRVSDSLGRFFDDVPADKRAITLHQLLIHTGALYSPFPGRACMTRDSARKAIWNSPLRFPPGSKYEYSNIGYAALAMVVEAVAHEPVETFVRRSLFDPLSMRHTGFVSDSTRWSDSLTARGYNITDGPYSPFGGTCQWNRKGGGSVISTIDDLFAWQQALAHHTILSAREVDELYTPYIQTDEGLDRYGYGWEIGRAHIAGVRLIRHRGDILPDGFNSGLFQYVDDSLVVILLSNETLDLLSGDTYPLQTGIEALLFGGTYGRPPTPPPARAAARFEPRAYLGTYTGADGVRFDVIKNVDGIAITGEGQRAIDALVRPKSDQWDTTRAGHFTAIALGAIRGAMKGDTQAVRAALGSSGSASDLLVRTGALGNNPTSAAVAGAVIRAWQNTNPPTGVVQAVVSVQALGTVPIRPFGPTSYVRAVFGADTVVYRVWYGEEGEFVTMHTGVPHPAWTPLVAFDRDRFVGYDYFNSAPIRVRFTRDAHGVAQRVTVETPEGAVDAVRASAH